MCHVDLTKDNCRPSIFKKGSGYCNHCINEWTKQWYKGHQEYAREKRRKYWTFDRRLAQRRQTQEFKAQAMMHYSQERMCCANPYGEHHVPYTNILALTIDHIDGGGSKLRKRLPYSNVYKWLVKQGFPKGYQVLCMNCQMIKKIINNEYHSELLEHENNSPDIISKKATGVTTLND